MEEAVAGIKELLNNPEAFAEFSRERFEHTDKDGNGLIDHSELEKAMVEISEEMGTPKPTKEVVQKTLAKYDADKSGKLDQKEFDLFSRSVLENFLAAFAA
jgi:Ca2+-binding EF-hand superfamily protein